MKRWMHGLRDAATQAPRLAAAGFEAVVLSDQADAETVASAGMEAWLCGPGFPLVPGPDAPDERLLAVGLDGRPHVWFNSASPCTPEVREASLEQYRRLAAAPAVTGILIDGCRFASPASGLHAFLTDFSPDAARMAANYGMDMDLMAHDLRRLLEDLPRLTGEPGTRAGSPVRPSVARRAGSAAAPAAAAAPTRLVEALLEYPGVLEWFRFRRRAVTDQFRDITEIIRAAGKRCGGYLFTPGLAPLVGQAYADLGGLLDVVSPMIYRAFRTAPGIAALNHELAALVAALRALEHPVGSASATDTSDTADTDNDTGATGPRFAGPQSPAPDAGDATFPSRHGAAVLQLAGYDGMVVGGQDEEAVRAGRVVDATGRETVPARRALGAEVELAPIIQIDDPDVPVAVGQVARGGADGVSFFAFREEWEELVGDHTA